MRVKTEQKRQEILQIAKEVFEEQGFDSASMAQISTRLGGSKGTLYNYFSSKEELFVEAMLELAQQHKKHLGCFEFQKGDHIRPLLIAFGTSYTEFISKPWYLEMLRTVIGFKNNTDVRKQFYEKGPRKGLTKIAGIFELAAAEGQLKQADYLVMARQFKALLDAEILTPMLLNAMKVPPAASRKEAVERAIDAFLAIYGK
ncbi:MAG: TetR/AcrR family transcriptional regulator [Pseudomonas fluorescens]|nr:MAG: TetR/AcrR family transcriptional regulator [Pseudomonas fluorescens]